MADNKKRKNKLFSSLDEIKKELFRKKRMAHWSRGY